MIKTRFAPSPTGYLHIGGARTALFAWAYAKQQGGQFLLRIEDTDYARSDAAHSEAIINALTWLDIAPDAAPVFQSANLDYHKAQIQQLLDSGQAYYCYATPEELTALRTAQLEKGESPRYDRRWRDSTATPPPGIAPSVRFKMPTDGKTVFDDAVKRTLAVENSELDDFIIARADGTPTYNLAAVADDIAMEITHIIRGDDHVMNTYRQWHLFNALTDTPPIFAHLPMILTKSTEQQTAEEGGDAVRYVRMSKRHATVDIDIYRRDGFLASAMCNYMARLSWAHGDAEVFDRDFFSEHFSFAAISQSPARFDLDKLKWLNHEHISRLSIDDLRQQAAIDSNVSDAAINLVRARSDTLNAIKAETTYFAQAPTPVLDATEVTAISTLAVQFADIATWDKETIKNCIKQTAKAEKQGFGAFGMPLRRALTGEKDSPDIAAIAAILGKKETLQRLQYCMQS